MFNRKPAGEYVELPPQEYRVVEVDTATNGVLFQTFPMNLREAQDLLETGIDYDRVRPGSKFVIKHENED